MFSLYMDRLEGFLEQGLLANLTTVEKRAVRIAGLLMPGLLFADDILFLST